MGAEARVVDQTTRAVVARTALFATLPPDLRELVAAALEPQHHAFGDTVVADGEAADALYIVTEGRARVVAHGDGGVEVPLASLEAGDVFGEIALLRGGVRTASVRASSALSAAAARRRRVPRAGRRPPAAAGPRRGARCRRRAPAAAAHVVPSVDAARGRGRGARGAAREQAVPAGTVVVREGERFGPLYVVREGRLRVFNQLGGPQRPLAFLGSGDVFGEAALFTGAPRAATVEALRDCVLLRLDPDDYARLVATHPALHDLIAVWVAGYRPDQLAGVPLDLEELLPAEVASLPPADPGAPAVVAGAEVAEDAEVVVAPAASRRRRRRGFPLVRQIDEADCGAACLAMLSRYHGRELRLARARVAARTGIDGTSLRSLVSGAQELGLQARAVKLSKARLDAALPAIVHWDGNHWVVAYAADARTVRYADPAGSRRRVPRAEFEERWSGYAVLAAPGPGFAEQAAEPGPGQWLRPLARPLLAACRRRGGARAARGRPAAGAAGPGRGRGRSRAARGRRRPAADRAAGRGGAAGGDGDRQLRAALGAVARRGAAGPRQPGRAHGAAARPAAVVLRVAPHRRHPAAPGRAAAAAPVRGHQRRGGADRRGAAASSRSRSWRR